MTQPVQHRFLDGRVVALTGDLTMQEVEAIVNAANASLLGGGGVDGAIHRRGGPRILAACQEIRRTRYPDGLPTGEVVMTTGGDLPARFVIHTVGPIHGRSGGQEAVLLAGCYRRALALAAQEGLRSIAFPSISTGAFGYPRPEAAAVSSEAIRSVLQDERRLEEVRLVFHQPADLEIFLTHHQLGGE